MVGFSRKPWSELPKGSKNVIRNVAKLYVYIILYYIVLYYIILYLHFAVLKKDCGSKIWTALGRCSKDPLKLFHEGMLKTIWY